MEILKQETELKLSKSQLQTIINSHIQQEQGLNDLFAMMVNGLMLSERSTFLDLNQKEGSIRKVGGTVFSDLLAIKGL